MSDGPKPRRRSLLDLPEHLMAQLALSRFTSALPSRVPAEATRQASLLDVPIDAPTSSIGPAASAPARAPGYSTAAEREADYYRSPRKAPDALAVPLNALSQFFSGENLVQPATGSAAHALETALSPAAAAVGMVPLTPGGEERAAGKLFARATEGAAAHEAGSLEHMIATAARVRPGPLEHPESYTIVPGSAWINMGTHEEPRLYHSANHISAAQSADREGVRSPFEDILYRPDMAGHVGVDAAGKPVHLTRAQVDQVLDAHPADVPIGYLPSDTKKHTTSELLDMAERTPRRAVPRGPNTDIQQIARQYTEGAGIQNEAPQLVDAVDPAFHGAVANAYDNMKLPKLGGRRSNPTQAAYDALIRETDAQHQAILDAGYRIEPVQSDPYKNSAEMMADVRDNRRLKVLASNAEHPYLTPEQNVRFRAVHDFFGHAAHGNQFGPLGEENAFRIHSGMFTPEAQAALATETRGQNSWVNFGSSMQPQKQAWSDTGTVNRMTDHSTLPVDRRPFATQKAALLPEWARDVAYPMKPNDATAIGSGRYVSRLERTIEGAKMTKGPPDQWMSYLRGQQTYPREELDWTGLEDRLHALSLPTGAGEAERVAAGKGGFYGKPRSLTRAEVLQAAREGGIKLDETRLGTGSFGGPAEPPTEYVAAGRWSRGGRNEERTFATAEERDAAINAAIDEQMQDYGSPYYVMETDASTEEHPEWAVYADGNRIDRHESHPTEDAAQAQADEYDDFAASEAYRDARREFALDGRPADGENTDPQYQQYTEPGGKNYREIVVQTAPAHPKRADLPYRSSHWEGVDNPLVHVRLNDRTGPNGKKTLFVEEIQSDWHQAGRDQGYKTSEKTREVQQRIAEQSSAMQTMRDAEKNRLRTAIPNMDELFYESTARVSLEENPAYQRLAEQTRQTGIEASQLKHYGVPNAPFKKTEDWTGLAWRRIMDEATKGGYDRVAWTTGEQQNRRYTLDTHVRALDYNPTTGRLRAWTHTQTGAGPWLDSTHRLDELPGLIGQEATDRLLASPRVPGGEGTKVHRLTGEDLHVGGSGMNAYYDEMLPRVVRDWAKKHGINAPVKQHRTLVPIGGARNALEGTNYIDVTPAMRARLRTKGQTLYNLAPIAGAGAIAAALAGRKRDTQK